MKFRSPDTFIKPKDMQQRIRDAENNRQDKELMNIARKDARQRLLTK